MFSGSTMEDYRASVLSGRKSIPVAVEIENMFPECTDHFITHFGSSDARTIWNSEAHFGGRYCLAMQLDIDVDYEHNVVRAKSPLRFWLMEFVKVQQESGERFRADCGESREFALDDWTRFKESNGDVSTLGFRANMQETVGFDDYVNSVRSNRKHISLISPETPTRRRADRH